MPTGIYPRTKIGRSPNVKCENCNVGVYRRPWQLKKGLAFISCGDCISKVKKKHPELQKGLIKIPKGFKWSEDSIRKRSGENNPAWKGGIDKDHRRLRYKREYTLWRIAVFMRDDYTCQMCNRRGGELQADHIKPFALYPEFRLAIDNGRTLCVLCHRQTDTWGNKPIYQRKEIE